MRTLALVAQKGGAGKTTLAIHLAGIALKQGLRVALFDTDPQGSCATWWHRRASDAPTLVEAPAKRLPQLLRSAEQDHYDLSIIDTAPNSTRETTLALRHSNLALMPSRPSLLDLDAITTTIELVQNMHTSAALVLNGCPPPRLAGLQPAITKEARAALKPHGIPIAPTAITQRAALAHALIDGRTLSEYDPASKAHKELTSLWRWLRKELQ